ncbi:MAG: ABC transporter permease [Blastocatellia bacterium]
MDKLLAIIKREYLMRVKSKGFIIGTILSPLLMASFALVPALILNRGAGTVHRLVVLDRTPDDFLFERVKKALAGGPDLTRVEKFALTRESVDEQRLAGRRAELDVEVRENRLAGYVVVPANILDQGKMTHHAKNTSDFIIRSMLERAFSVAVREKRMVNAGLDPAKVESLSRGVELDTINEQGQKEEGQSFLLAWVLMFFIYLTILIYGMMVMRGVIEEKQSRIIEVLLSSVKPFQLMLGKLIGVGAVGLTQCATWALTGFLLSSMAAAQMFAFGNFKMPHVPVSLLIYFLIFFVLGFFLYATLYAMVGAMVSSDEDGQQVQMPVTMSIIVPIMLSTMVMRAPDSALSTGLSLFPLFSPILMFMRIAVKQPPFWQIALSIILLIGAILGVIWFASKIYRVGVLMYGKRPTIPELMKWLKYS